MNKIIAVILLIFHVYLLIFGVLSVLGADKPEEVVKPKEIHILPKLPAKPTIPVLEPKEEDTTKSELSYFIEIENGFVVEESLYSICEYVGSMYDIEPELLQAIAWVESRYKVDAVSHSNAKGICQIMEKWHSGRMQKLGVEDIFDPYGSVLLCADIIDELRTYTYGHDINFVLMAYNMGADGAAIQHESGRVTRYAIDVMNKYNELKE